MNRNQHRSNDEVFFCLVFLFVCLLVCFCFVFAVVLLCVGVEGWGVLFVCVCLFVRVSVFSLFVCWFCFSF